ncbi:hypothetical protein D3C80_915380 [compost metagenome]
MLSSKPGTATGARQRQRVTNTPSPSRFGGLDMRAQATRNNPHRDEQVEIIGCVVSLLLCLTILVVLYSTPWSMFR